MKNGNSLIILLADDDDDFCVLVQKALERSGIPASLRIVEDGDELLKYLKKQEPYRNAQSPQLIFLDLNMPRKDGRAALREIQADQDIGRVPIIVLTTSQAEKDVAASYRHGASSYITKPDSFNRLVDIMKAVRLYWLDTVTLPGSV